MTTSLRLLLEDFLGLMREEGELDVFLPLLLSAMGHSIVYRAQKGPRQFGVDISSVGTDTDDRKKLFLWLVKRGDIGRHEWDSSGPQSVRQSINDVGDVYIPTHIAPEHSKLPIKLIVLTNGDFNSAIQLSLSQFLLDWSRRKGAETECVNGSRLAELTESNLLDEYVLPAEQRALLRRMLANVGSPDLSVSVGRALIDGMLEGATAAAPTKGKARKALLGGLRGIRTALRVLLSWADAERNLSAPYRLSEYAVLAVWSRLHPKLMAGDVETLQEYMEVLGQLSDVALKYHAKLLPFYRTQNGLAHGVPDSLLVAESIFFQAGRLGLQGLYWARIAVGTSDTNAAAYADHYASLLTALIETHSGVASLAFDHQTVDLHSGLLLLLATNRRPTAEAWIRNVAGRMVHLAGKREHWPLSCSFDEALAVRHRDAEPTEEVLGTTTLVPLLLVWSAALGLHDVYAAVRDRLVPKLGPTTPNMWTSDVGFDSLLSDPSGLAAHGVGEALTFFEAEPSDFLLRIGRPLPEVQGIEHAPWYQSSQAYLPLLAALHWRLQIPREMMAAQVVALCNAQGAAH